MNTSDTRNQGSVLIADDNAVLRRLIVRAVEGEGFDTLGVSSGSEAIEAFERGSFDLVITDIDMPGMNGIELLKAIRRRDLDVPVVIITGGPSIDTAALAVEHGATRYLVKPVDLPSLRETIRRTSQAGRLARARRQLVDVAAGGASQTADLQARFDKALERLFMMYQPIVRWSDRSIYAYEALVRSSEPSIPHPGALFDAADALDRVEDVGRGVRSICADPIAGTAGFLLFVNLHTKELLDESLYATGSPLALIADRVVFEITERARLETVPDIAGRVARLRDLGFRIAIDDIGAGYAGLTSFAALEPDVMKLDMALVRGIHESKTKLKLVGSMIQVCADLGVQVVGEGVETEAERDALVGLGCDLFQGYLFSKPQKELVQLKL